MRARQQSRSRPPSDERKPEITRKPSVKQFRCYSVAIQYQNNTKKNPKNNPKPKTTPKTKPNPPPHNQGERPPLSYATRSQGLVGVPAVTHLLF